KAAIGCDGARHRLCAIHLELAFVGAQEGYRRRIVLLAVCHLCCRCLVVIQHGLGLIALASGGGNGYQVLLPVLAAALTGNNRRYGEEFCSTAASVHNSAQLKLGCRLAMISTFGSWRTSQSAMLSKSVSSPKRSRRNCEIKSAF